MSADSILTSARQYLGVHPTESVVLEPIQKGASGRTIVRVKCNGHEPFVGMHWTDEKPENDRFPDIARFLRKSRINAPEVLHEDLKWRVVLLQDLGGKDLLSLKGKPFAAREPYYRSAFEQLDRLFYTKVPADLELMSPFDEATYRWEQEYFFDHCVEGLLGMDATELREASEFKEMAEGLGKSAKNLVHRDFQSQNLMLLEGKVWWVDFQGMRRGRQEYDLASLVFDPYLDHSVGEREKLMELWEEVTEERPAERIFHECAAQRMMQAMGAYGFIVREYGNEWYRQFVPVAAKMLGEVTRGTKLAPLLEPVIGKARG